MCRARVDETVCVCVGRGWAPGAACGNEKTRAGWLCSTQANPRGGTRGGVGWGGGACYDGDWLRDLAYSSN